MTHQRKKDIIWTVVAIALLFCGWLTLTAHAESRLSYWNPEFREQTQLDDC